MTVSNFPCLSVKVSKGSEILKWPKTLKFQNCRKYRKSKTAESSNHQKCHERSKFQKCQKYGTPNKMIFADVSRRIRFTYVLL